jgi:hypothetical protein
MFLFYFIFIHFESSTINQLSTNYLSPIPLKRLWFSFATLYCVFWVQVY